jgi:ferrous-iron efflux pump FieF
MTSEVRTFLIATLACLVDATLTAWLASTSDSLTVLSAFLSSGIELLAVVAAFVTYIVVRHRGKSQSRFAFGIGKLENVTSMVIAGMMLISAQHVFFEAVGAIQNPNRSAAGPTLATLAIFFGYAVVSTIIWLHYRRLEKITRTAILKSQSELWYSKACNDIPFAIAILLIYSYQDMPWGVYLDPIASFIGVGFLLYAAWSIGYSSIGDLLDVSLDAYSHEVIERALKANHCEYQMHLIKSRRSGPDIFIELHLKFNELMTLKEIVGYAEKIKATAKSVCPAAEVLVIPYTNESALQPNDFVQVPVSISH